MVTVRLLGGLALERDGVTLPPPDGRPARALLAWLALHPGRHARALVAARLWPDVLDESARGSLRAALTALRHALGADALEAGREQVALAAAVEVDVRRFDALLREGRAAEAAALYAGDLLPDVAEPWLAEARDRYRDRARRALRGLMEAAEAAGDLAAAAELAARRADLDGLHEPAQRDLLRLLWLTGDRAGAIEAYERLADRLRSERRVAPSPETRALLAALRAEQPPAPAGVVRALPLPGLLARPAAPLVGRDAELRTAEAALAASAEGQRLLLVAGEAGIGKTRLAVELCRRAHARGAAVLAGRAHEDALAPFQPWAEAVAGLAASLGDDELAAALGPGAAELGRVVPGLTARLGVEPGADTEGARFRLFEAIAEVLRRLAAERPVVVLLDDLHWADTPGLLLATHVLRLPEPLRLLCVATYRPAELGRAHPLARAFADLRRDVAVDRIALGGLAVDALAALAAADGAAPAHGVVVEVAARTGGNPFFARELFRHVAETGATGLPEGVREVVGERAGRLTATANAVLGAAAVCGGRFDCGVLEAALPDVAGAVVDAVEEAVRAGLVREEPGAPGRYAFAHALVQEALYEELSTVRRVRLHGLVADALEARRGDLAEIARHRFEAASVDAAASTAAAVAAGDAALAALAYEDAAAQYARALEALEGDAGRRCDVLVALGDAHVRAGEVAAGREALDAAIALARALRDGRRLARAALARAGPSIVILGVDHDEVARYEDALDLLGDDDPALRSRLLARLAIATYYEHDAARRQALAGEAVGLARAHGDVHALARALVAERIAVWSPEHLDRRLAVTADLIALGEASGDGEAELLGRHWRIVDLVESGDRAAFDAELERYAALAERVRLPQHRWYGRYWQALPALLAGDAERGLAIVAEAVAIGLRAGDDNATRMPLFAQFSLRGGERHGLAVLPDEMLEIFAWGIDRSHVSRAFRSGYAWHLACSGDLDAARRELRTVGPPSELPHDMNWLSATFELACAAELVRDRALAAELLGLLAPFAGRQAIMARAVCTYGSVDFALGLAAATVGDLAAARAHLAVAAAADEAFGATVAAARARQVLAELGGPG